MRILPLALAALLAVGAVAGVQAALPSSVVTAPVPATPSTDPAQTSQSVADQAAMCVAGDVYNTGSLPCAGLVCYGQTQYAWQTCLSPPNPPCTVVRCTDTGLEQVALCVYGDAYNTGGAPCEGGVCVGYTMGHWVDCYPRIPPCLACPPPPPATNLPQPAAGGTRR